jgi:hypothetical protein
MLLFSSIVIYVLGSIFLFVRTNQKIEPKCGILMTLNSFERFLLAVIEKYDYVVVSLKICTLQCCKFSVC